MCTISLFLPPEWWVGSLLFSLCRFFFLKASKKRDHAQLFFLLFAWWTLNYLLFLSLPRSFSFASAAMIILITHSTNEKNIKKNGRSLGIGLASSLLLYEAAAKREWGHKARREKKNRPISMHRTLELMPLCRYSPFFLSLSPTQLYNDDDKQQQQQ